MFRKTTSDRESGPTIGGEISKELAPYYDRVAAGCRKLLETQPKLILGGMVVAILISAVLAFSVMRPGKPPKISGLDSLSTTVGSSMENLAGTASAFRELLELQSAVNTLMEKDALDSADSLFLDSALTRLQYIQRRLNPGNGKQPNPK